MADLHELLLKYLDQNKEKYEEVLKCIENKEGDDQFCIDSHGDGTLQKYYQAIKPFEDDKNFVAIYAIDEKIPDPTKKGQLDDALEVIKDAAESNSAKDFCEHHFDTFSYKADALSKWMQSEFNGQETQQKQIVSIIYAIIKYYRENGTIN
jgi:hypothetical protein